jgi:hypothetical protein
MDRADVGHILAGALLAMFSIISLCYGCDIWVSVALTIALSLYIVLLFIQCALRAKSDGTDQSIFPLPNRTWALLLVTFLVTSNVFSFSNMYLKSGGVTIQTENGKPAIKSKLDAIYFSLVTLTTLGYGDFVPNEKGRLYVIFHLSTGFLLLLIIIPVVASRVTTW